MPSGKKARGRKNRAKKEATLTAAQRALWEQTILQNDAASSNASASTCEHALAALPRIPQEGPAVSFMNSLAVEGFFNDAARLTDFDPVTFCIQSLSRFPAVQEEESERSLATALLLRFIRNVFVHDSAIEGENWFHSRPQNEVGICCVIIMLEICGTYSYMNVVARRAIKTGEKFARGNRRDLVKFVTKRIPCACLKKLHCAARKKLAKVGGCRHCGKEFPRSQLHVCTGCMIAQYCSKECQRANWSYHKQGCGYPEVMSPHLPPDYVW